MHGRQTSYTNRTFTSLQFGIFFRIFERMVVFIRFFAQLKWSGCIYMLTVVSGLINNCSTLITLIGLDVQVLNNVFQLRCTVDLEMLVSS